jgi:hypothetical protein
VWLLVGVMLGLAGSGLMRVWPAAAQPQVLPNAADQRNAMVLELRATNAKLDAIHSLLASGKVVVQVKEASGDAPAGGAKAVDR